MDNSKAVRDLTKEGLNIIPADDTFPPLNNDDLQKALQGKTMYSNTSKTVINFRKAPAGSGFPYQGEIDGEIILFDSKGVASDGSTKLTFASTSIDNKGTQGESQTRSDGDEFVMNSLNYKEQVALRVLAAMIKHESNPLGYDDSKIKLLVSQSFRVAVEFQNRAIMFRQEEQGGGGGEVDVNPDSLANNTERILYNINECLKNGIAIKNAEDENISVVVDGTVDVDIQNSNLATRSDVVSAEDHIIDAMPELHCNYPSSNK